MEAACGSSVFTKGFVYVMTVVVCMLKMFSPFLLDIGVWIFTILLKLLFFCLSVVWWCALVGAIVGLHRAISEIEGIGHR